jgi:hypothetical protein
MIPDNLVFLQVVSHEPYFQWQVEVQITNFRKFEISNRMHILVWYHKGSNELKNWLAIQRKYPEVKIFLYEDSGVNLKLYIPQLRPHCLKKHFKKYEEEFKDKIFFYHDADIIFNFLPDFEKLCQDEICWQSDCSHYIGYDYLRRKEIKGNMYEYEAIDKLAEIGGVTRDIIKEYALKTGGAQTILKNIDYKFWEDVENQVLRIRNEFYWGNQDSPNIGSINHRYFTISKSANINENAGFQSWCADMWALNFALWKRGLKTDITSELDFSWATDNTETYKKKPIYHNAGSTGLQPGVFHKGNWIKTSPLGYGNSIAASINSASWFYVEAIKEVK